MQQLDKYLRIGLCSLLLVSAQAFAAPQTYHKNGLSLQIPETWDVKFDTHAGVLKMFSMLAMSERIVLIEKREGANALLTLVLRSAKRDKGLLSFARGYSARTAKESGIVTFSAGEFEPLKPAEGKAWTDLQPQITDALLESFNIQFSGQMLELTSEHFDTEIPQVDIPHVREYYQLSSAKERLYAILQVPLDEREGVRADVDAMIGQLNLE